MENTISYPMTGNMVNWDLMSAEYDGKKQKFQRN